MHWYCSHRSCVWSQTQFTLFWLVFVEHLTVYLQAGQLRTIYQEATKAWNDCANPLPFFLCTCIQTCILMCRWIIKIPTWCLPLCLNLLLCSCKHPKILVWRSMACRSTFITSALYSAETLTNTVVEHVYYSIHQICSMIHRCLCENVSVNLIWFIQKVSQGTVVPCI